MEGPNKVQPASPKWLGGPRALTTHGGPGGARTRDPRIKSLIRAQNDMGRIPLIGAVAAI